MGSSKSALLTIGGVISFKTTNGKHGMAMVEPVTSGTSGQIKLNIKVQQ